MVFSSIEFLLYFLPLFLILYALTPGKLKNVTLLSGSLVFYALGDPEYLALLIASVMINYFLGLRLARKEKRKKKGSKYKNNRIWRKAERKRSLVFVSAIVLNLGVLIFFKRGMDAESLPLGISFYTFQILSYLIDVYRGEERAETSFVKLATYITMFPQLLSGPIVSYYEVRDSLGEREFHLKSLQEGLKVFTVGLTAKVLLADRIGLLWQKVQVTGFESITTPMAWMGAIAYSMKIYFDFSGYSLMAIGLGRIFGFELPVNFRDPYMASSVRDFYRRWHITLTRWFRKYVYIPLGGNRKGMFRTLCNLLMVWLLTAVWHGSTANFLIWGILLWLLIALEKLLDATGLSGYFRKGPLSLLPHLYLWVVIPVTWMCFAIEDVSQLRIYLGRMFGILPAMKVNGADWRNALADYGGLFGVCFLACTPVVRRLFLRFKNTVLGLLLLAALFWLCVWRIQVEGQNPFMYRWF